MTHYGNFLRQQFFIEVCGLEILTNVVPPFVHIFAKNSGNSNEIVHPDNYHELFHNDDHVHCPTTTYTLETSNDRGATFVPYATGNNYL